MEKEVVQNTNGFEADVHIERDRAYRIKFTTREEAESWAKKMHRKILSNRQHVLEYGGRS